MSAILNGDSKAIDTAINQEKQSNKREQATIAEQYYDYEHDILSNTIYYLNDNDQLVEDEFASNIRIPHPFFTEIVDQGVSTELSKPVELNTDDEIYTGYLEEYWGTETHLFLQEMVEGASKKGKEYAYIRQTAGTPETSRITFQVSDSLQTFEVIDETGDVIAVIRYYTKDLIRKDKVQEVDHCEVWTKEGVMFYVKNEEKEWIVNTNISPNPRPHILGEKADEETGEKIQLGKSYGRIPFFKLKNNKKEKTDLEPIKELIDDYDLMNAFMSNDLQDYRGAIYVTKGYQGDDLSKLRLNVKSKGVIGVDSDGDFDMKTYNVPVEGRIKKMETDKKNIYKFGMAFDSTAISDSQGNVTNVQIMAGYSLLMMKLNKKEAYLRTLIDWMLELVTEDINRRYGANFDHRDIEVTIHRELMINKEENATIEKTEAETKQIKLAAVLDIAAYLPQEKILHEICDILELDWEEVKQMLIEEVALPSLVGVGDEGDEQVRA